MSHRMFDALVATYTRTCIACPTQYEGRLRDGRTFYFRYRSGIARLGFGQSPDAAVDDSWNRSLVHGDNLDGDVTEDEFKELFTKLAMVEALNKLKETL